MKRKAQAMAEAAILGSLILLCFSVILMYGQRFDGQQRVKMKTFRQAIHKAYARNSSASYAARKDERFTNIFTGYGEGQSSALSSSASVMWQKGAPGQKWTKDQTAFAYQLINNEKIGTLDSRLHNAHRWEDDITLPWHNKISVALTGQVNETTGTPISVWLEDARKTTEYGALDAQGKPTAVTERREDADGKITNTQLSTLKEKVETKLHVRYDIAVVDARNDENTPEYVNEGEHYDYVVSQDGKQYQLSGDVENLDPVTEGAFLNDATNRVEYRSDQVGNKIIRQRTWTTPY